MLKKFPKILIGIFLIIFLFQIAGLIFLLIAPAQSQAVSFTPRVKIPGLSGGAITEKSIGEYIVAIYKYTVGIVGILAVVVMMIGGISWMVAGGNASRIGEAKAWIGAALTGLILVLSSWIILNTINPELVKIKPINLTGIGKIPDCCKGDGPCQPISQMVGNKLTYSCPRGCTQCGKDKKCQLIDKKNNTYICAKDFGNLSNEGDGWYYKWYSINCAGCTYGPFESKTACLTYKDSIHWFYAITSEDCFLKKKINNP